MDGHWKRARWIALDALEPWLPAAVIAAEDQRFHEHAGTDRVEPDAVEMERALGKPRILERYLYTVDRGPSIRGAGAAACTYFRKSPSKLAPREAPARELRRGAPAPERAVWVLSQMRTLPKRERVRWARRPLAFAPERATSAAPRALAAR
jgi:hypothetical protein